jgi:AraC-like DNA-binding protein
MQTPFKSYSVQWKIDGKLLIDSQINTRYPTDDLLWVQYPFPAEVGDGFFTSLQLSSGLSLHHSRFRFPQANTTTPPLCAVIEMNMNEPALLVTSVLVGGFSRYDHLHAVERQVAPHRTMLQWTDRVHSTMRFDRMPAVEVLYLRASQSSLQGLIGHELTTRLMNLVKSTDPLHALPRSVTAPLAFCFDYQLKGSIHKLHAQTKALEFLEALIRYFESQQTVRPTKPECRAKTVLALITNQPGNVPTTAALAKTLGMSVKTLNLAFVQDYGMTVAQFIREHRLALAHEQLTTSSLPIREIASRLGYSQMSNFSALFKSFYGYSPSTLRQQRVSHTQG